MASPQYSFPILPEPAKLITLYTPIWLLNYTSIAVQPPFPSPSPTELHNLHWSKPEGRIRVRPLSALPESSIENEKSRKQSKPFLSIDDILMKKDDKIVKKATNNIKRRAENFDPEDNPMAKQQKLSEAHEKNTLSSELYRNPPRLLPYPYFLQSEILYNSHNIRNVCEFCGKLWKTKTEFTRHMRTHTGEKPYRCIHCKQSFSLYSNLQGHVRHVHIKRPMK